MIKEDKLVQMIADAALDENALDLVILDVADLTIIADYFVIASGRSIVQIKSIAETVETSMAEQGVELLRKDGFQEGKWIVLDFGGVIFHVFRQEERDYYDIENLWGEAKEVKANNS